MTSPIYVPVKRLVPTQKDVETEDDLVKYVMNTWGRDRYCRLYRAEEEKDLFEIS
jgi:hypothetical protein